MKTTFKPQPIRKIFKYRNNINLDPEFQREKVWPEKKQQYFIDTILKKWGVPKLYLAVADADNYICVDGKQRLIAIFSFLSNKLKLNKKFSESDGEKTYKNLSKNKQDIIDDYKLPIEEITNYTEEDISELFKRLQGGVSLNSGENLMAVTGDLKNEIKKISKHNFFKNSIVLSNKRYSHFTVSAQIVFLEINGISNLSMSKLEDMLKIHKDLSNSGVHIKSKLAKIKKVLDEMEIIFPKKCPYLKNRATIVSIYLLISEIVDKKEIKPFSDKIYKFFTLFMKQLDTEISKGVKAKDAQLINYQSAVTQGADKQKTINLRRSIILERLFEFNSDFYYIFNPDQDPKIKFDNLYGKFEIKFGNSVTVDKWIFSKKPRLKKYNCRAGKSTESLPTHIRHCIHHKSHGNFILSDLDRATKLLKELERSIPK